MPGMTFQKKVHQKLLTPLQQSYLYSSIDKMLEAGVIKPSKPEDIKCISSTTLAQKTHECKRLSLEELQHRVNNECMAYGIETKFDLSPRTTLMPDDSNPDEPKWRICQIFNQINKVMKVTQMPQGNIRAKQQQLSGHRWVSGLDFAVEFYAVLVDLESRLYTAFYIEGKGYFWYK